ncbi:MAG TPA: hypothetical protein VIG46_11050 [Candidatus Baltobacteraceae bacterium]|jgi:hypothetical protein
MEFIGTNLSITLGAWRLRFVLALEETEERISPAKYVPHKMRVVPMDDRVEHRA